MSIDDSNVVDLVAMKPEASFVRLLITDHWEWADDYSHHLALQRKLNGYIAFVEGGQLERQFPDAKGKGIRIEVHFLHEPPESTKQGFLRDAAQFLKEAGFELHWQVEAGS